MTTWVRCESRRCGSCGNSEGVQSLGAGMYGLCVNVDTAGPMSNMNAIPEGEYTATVSVVTETWREDLRGSRRAARSVPLHATAHR